MGEAAEPRPRRRPGARLRRGGGRGPGRGGGGLTGRAAPRSFFLADLHLRPEEGESIGRFAAFLEGLRPGERLFVLGDLFDVWLGPRSLRVPGFAPALDALARTTGRGVLAEAVVGNRDFLLDGAFEGRTGVRMRGEGLVTVVAGRRALLVHGDTLCTKDLAYQRYRRVVRSAPLRALARLLPGGVAGAFAGGLRKKSVAAVAAKLPETKSIVPEAAAREASAQGCTLVLCGHAHAPSVRKVGEVFLVVLPAWGDGGDAAAEVGGELRAIDGEGRVGAVLLPRAP